MFDVVCTRCDQPWEQCICNGKGNAAIVAARIYVAYQVELDEGSHVLGASSSLDGAKAICLATHIALWHLAANPSSEMTHLTWHDERDEFSPNDVANASMGTVEYFVAECKIES